MLAVKLDKIAEPPIKNINENKKITFSLLNDSMLNFKLKFNIPIKIIIHNTLFSTDMRILDKEPKSAMGKNI